jgi:hypothetical protein
MKERDFVTALMTTISKVHPESVQWRLNDAKTLGLPDITVFLKAMELSSFNPLDEWYDRPMTIVIEAKAVRPFLKDPFDPGRRTAPLLKHAFTGPQVSMLRKLKEVDALAFGLIRVTEDAAFRVEPEDIPADTGNFTHEQLVKVGTLVKRENGLWQFWRKN